MIPSFLQDLFKSSTIRGVVTTCRILRGVSRTTDTSSRRSRNTHLFKHSHSCANTKQELLPLVRGRWIALLISKKWKHHHARVYWQAAEFFVQNVYIFFYCFAMNINYYQQLVFSSSKSDFFYVYALLNKTALYTQTLTILTGHSGDLTLILSKESSAILYILTFVGILFYFCCLFVTQF